MIKTKTPTVLAEGVVWDISSLGITYSRKGSPYHRPVVELPDKFISGRKRFSNERLRKLGWQQKVPLKERLKEVIRWYEGIMK